VDETLLQFGPRPAPQPGLRDRVTLVPRAVRCPICAQHFSGDVDARFCPFDGSKLEEAPNWDPRADPLIGHVVDKRYKVLLVLGEGGMGTVYQVKHVALGREFAMKALRRDLAQDGALSARFIQEAKAAAAVAHPAIVQITDFGQLPSKQPYFVMELLSGHSLAWLIKAGGPLPAARAVRVLRQVAEALAAAHDAGIIHRDLKPDNVHVSEAIGDRDVVKVLDFGLAKVAGASRLTRAGMVFGTPHYMSPEQATGDPVDHRTDIYSLGVVMYEMFTGRVPFEADSYMGVLTKHMYVSPTPPSEVLGGSKELGALEDITLRCLEKKPDRRFASMAELLAELDRIARLQDTGEVELSPSSSGDRKGVRSVLADELEAPSPEEVRIALGRAGVRPHLAPAVVVGASGLVALVLLVIALAWLTRSPAPLSLQKGSTFQIADAVRQTVVAAGREKTRAPPAQAPAAEAPQPAPSTRPATGPNRRPTPKRVALSTARPAAAPAESQPRKKPKRSTIGAGEIIDPWAE